MEAKVTKVFSWPLFKQDIRSNWALALICTLIMCMMSIVISFAMDILNSVESNDYEEAETEFYSYLYVLASYDESTGADLSYEDFIHSDDLSQYEQAFDMFSSMAGMDLSVTGFENVINELEGSDTALDVYVTQFEYTYALGDVEGVFSGDTLDINDLILTMIESMGISSDMLENISEMDTTVILNRMYHTIMLILPMILFIVFVGNNLVVDKVDKGSMAYILSTPTKRSAVTITQLLFFLIVPFLMIAVVSFVKIGAGYMFSGEVEVAKTLAMFGGMYVLIEAMASICYLGSCIFNLSRYGLALGGGLNAWFFLASIVGMFGSEDMVSMGVGVEALGNFNNLTLIGLFDISALNTVGSGAIDTSFIWKLCVLAAIAVVCYVVGSIRFQKRDLPL